MAYNKIKEISRKIGLYRLARDFNRIFLNREELKQEREDLKFYKSLIKRNDLVFDVGGNYGEKCRVFLKLGARVVTFEPQPDCMAELKNRCGNHKNLITKPIAVSASKGIAKLYVRELRGTSGLVKDWESKIENVIEVPTVTLDDMIIEHGRPQYIKIDVEGYEYEVIKGLHEVIPLLSFEYHMKEKDIQKTFDCINHLSTLGEIRLNLTPAENLIFQFREWLEPSDFFKVFPEKFKSKSNFWYGDIFVKFISS